MPRIGPRAKNSPRRAARVYKTAMSAAAAGTVRLGDTDVHRMGFGARWVTHQEPSAGRALLRRAVEVGIDLIDTADVYDGSEELIADTLHPYPAGLVIATKGGQTSVDGQPTPDCRPEYLKEACERSLRALRVDTIDVYQLHNPDPNVPVEESVGGMAELVKEGKTRFIGYSGDSKAARYAVECGRFDALQTSVNIVDQECIELTLPLAKEKGMGVIAKRPIANAVWRHPSRPGNDYHVEYWNRLQKLGYDFAKGENSEKAGVDGPAAIAMRFTAMQPGVSVLIVGTTKPDRWKENAELIRAGPLPKELEASIRARWKEVAESDWIGRT